MSDRAPGRSKRGAVERCFRILNLLADAMPDWVSRDLLADEAGFGGKTLPDRRRQLTRDIRDLRGLGWDIEINDLDGAESRVRLNDRDPRLATLLTPEQQAQLSRAARAGGLSAEAFGLPTQPLTGTPAIEVLLQRSDNYKLESFLHALTYRCLVHTEYSHKPRTLHIDRVFQTSTGKWRVVARDRGEQKHFRLDRFGAVSLEAPGTASAVVPDLTSLDPLQYQVGDPITATVVVPFAHESQVIRELGRPLDRTQEGEEVTLRIRVVNRELWLFRLCHLGKRVSVTGPDELRDEFRAYLTGFVAGAR